MPSPYREPGTAVLSPPVAGTVSRISRVSAAGSSSPRPIALQNRVRSAAVLISAPAELAQDMFSAVVSARVVLLKIRYPVACGRGSAVLLPGAKVWRSPSGLMMRRVTWSSQESWVTFSTTMPRRR